ncbi:MAG: DNA polymerase IV [Patescibacteria group bacterium]
MNLSTSKPLTISSWPRAILHVDGDAFFASCEQALHPEYRGRPVITGKERGIVAAASYEAKAKGVGRGVPLWEVKKLCPNAIILPSDYETYSLFSKRLFSIMRRFTSQVEEYSIDEGFADLTGLQRPFHCSYSIIAQKIKATIESELGITVSVGLSLSKVLCKIASKYKKPSGFTAIAGREIHKYLKITPIEKIWGIGPRTAAYCLKLGIKNALDFVNKNENFIKQHFTKPHYEMWQELNGHSVYDVAPEEKTDYISISKTKTFTPPSNSPAYVYAQLVKNLENACIKARRHNLVAQDLIIILRLQNYRTVGLEAKLNRASNFPQDMMTIIHRLFSQLFKHGNFYRATGVVLANLIPLEGLQRTLFEPIVRIEKLKRLYEAVDKMSAKFGKHCLYSAASLSAQKTPQHVQARGDMPIRKLNRIKGESVRKHLTIPMLMNKVN